MKPKAEILLLGLCWAMAAPAAMDPNVPDNTQALRRQIMESQIQPLFLSITSVSQMDLDELISTLDRLEVPAASARARGSSAASSAPTPSAAEGESVSPAEQEPQIRPPAAAVEKKDSSVRQPVDSDWLKQIDAIDQPVDPMALGNVLFHSGQMERAERFYRIVLEKAGSPGDPDWQWAMYQRANCLRRSQPAKALALYQELIQKAPNSSWSSAAAAQQATLAWFENVQESTIKRLLSDPNSLP